MTGYPLREWISSKRILEITGISRATLNNYIRLGLLPKPVLANPRFETGGPKRLGYFPPSVLDRIEEIRQLKKSGKTIEEIGLWFHKRSTERDDLPTYGDEAHLQPPVREKENARCGPSSSMGGADGGLCLTFDAEGDPAYLIDRSLRVCWMNRAAEERFFMQETLGGEIEKGLSIFKLLFHWKVHESVSNWKDLMRFHMTYAKGWIDPEKTDLLYAGITRSEADLLQELWEVTDEISDTVFRVARIPLLTRDGLAETIRIHSLVFREGVLFVVGTDASHLA